MEIYIVRHGETVWNTAKRLQGNVDIELNENGRELARRVGERLARVAFDKIYSSPLLRAYETACLIRGHRNIPIVRDGRLREISFGTYEGRSVKELETDENDTFQYFFSDPGRYRAPEGGEELEEVCARTAEFMREVIEPQAQVLGRVMIVGHGAMDKAIMCHVKGHDISHYWSGGLQKNCGIILVCLDGDGYRVLDEHLSFA